MNRLVLSLALALLACEGSAVGGGGGQWDAQPTDAGDGPDTLAADGALPPDAGCESQPERCNGQDDNCNGQIDESPTDVGRACGVTEGVCEAGQTVCTEGVLSCRGGIAPGGEICNGLDDDCDGQTDEEAADIGAPCEEACGAGRWTCLAGRRACVGEGVTPGDEICNGQDDDCDGVVDNHLAESGEPCGVSEGRCTAGVTRCLGGAWTCDGAVAPADEICNGLDDDCDGEVDEGIAEEGEACDAGACGAGERRCVEGALVCVGSGEGQPESCNGLDDDCDGQTDESDPQVGLPCGPDLGVCVPGVIACLAGELTCEGGRSPVPEACNTLDDDCDGEVDEGIECNTAGELCGDNQGCASGFCYSDAGVRYCSATCNADDPPCPDGLTCEQRNGRGVCVRSFLDCTHDGECADGEGCMLTPYHTDAELGGQCRPLVPGGQPVGAVCGDGLQCAGNLCMADLERCSRLCLSASECPDGFACALTAFTLGNGERLELGLCLEGCTGDADCDDGRLCQYGLEADRLSVKGYCDRPFEGGAVGDACNYSADPPLGCDHGYCWRQGDARYCSQGCVTAEDCPANWSCLPTPMSNTNISFGLCRRP